MFEFMENVKSSIFGSDESLRLAEDIGPEIRASVENIPRGQAPPGSLQAALGHYAEASMDLDQVPTNEMSYEEKRAIGARRVAEGYTRQGDDLENDPEAYAPVDLDSPESRLKFLDGFVQNSNPGSTNDDHACGPTSLVAAAVLAEGPAGVKKLLDAVGGFSGVKSGEIDAIRALIDDGRPLSKADLTDVTTYIHDALNKAEGQDMNDPALPEDAKNIKVETTQALIGSNKALGDMMRENHMEIAGVDLGGKNGDQYDHFVLMVNGEDGNPMMVYDPLKRARGQVVAQDAAINPGAFDKVDSPLHDYALAKRT